jgi:hypothetical protein
VALARGGLAARRTGRASASAARGGARPAAVPLVVAPGTQSASAAPVGTGAPVGDAR